MIVRRMCESSAAARKFASRDNAVADQTRRMIKLLNSNVGDMMNKCRTMLLQAGKI